MGALATALQRRRMKAPGRREVPGGEGQRHVHAKENIISAVSLDTSPVPSYTCKC